jgi:hypothetical protein
MSDEPAPSLVYKEFEIHPAPYQLADTGEWKQWKVHIYILRHTEEKTHSRKFTAEGSCPSKEDAIQLCYDFGKKVIDGEVPDCTVKGM